MKKILLLLLGSVLLTSCYTEAEGYARKQMKKSIMEIAKNPESISFSDIETVFANDSLCVLHFVLRGQNGFGGYNLTNYEYIYGVKSEYIHYETLRDIEKNGTILNPEILTRDVNKGKSLEDIIMLAASLGRTIFL